jgi:hypothetical protein
MESKDEVSAGLKIQKGTRTRRGVSRRGMKITRVVHEFGAQPTKIDRVGHCSQETDDSRLSIDTFQRYAFSFIGCSGPLREKTRDRLQTGKTIKYIVPSVSQ